MSSLVTAPRCWASVASRDPMRSTRPLVFLISVRWNGSTSVSGICRPPRACCTTVHEFKRHPENLVAIETRVIDAAPPAKPLTPTPARVIPKPPTGATPQAALWTAGGMVGRIQDVLNRKGQVILYGPPGTGKTFWAEQAATQL